MNGTVMIVDDSLTVRMDLIEAFAAEGMRAIGCETAAAARETLARESVGLVILDVLLPDGNGVELAKEIRAHPAAANVPILMLSTEGEVRDRIRGLTIGIDDYVGKPYDRDYVVARARELLGRSQDLAPAANATILVIDDSATFRAELCGALEGAGYRVLSAKSGEEGLRSAAANRPTAIIVDGVLPGIDGASVVRKIRLDAALRQTPCVLLTGSSVDRSVELHALDAGADAFVRKEEDMDIVLARVAAVLRVSVNANRETASLLGPKKVLAVDDSMTYLEELTTILCGEGYDVIPARSGEEALEMLAVQPVDCILLDRLMPGMDGTETCRRIKASPATRDIPLIMLTAMEDRNAMIEGLGTGADDYVLKSSEEEVLKARVRAQLRRKQIEDESRRIRLQLLRKELEAAEARAAKELAETKAALVEELEQKNRKLEIFANEAWRAEEKFRALAEAASDAILSADQEGMIVYANPAAERLFDYTRAELLGQPLTGLMPERFRAAHAEGFRRYLSGAAARIVGKGVVELTGRRKDGGEFPIELSLGEWREETQHQFTAIIRDITVRLEMEQRIRALNEGLERRAAALAAANKELEAFSYSVSHDLRAPLRSIDGFSLALLEDCGDQLDEHGKHYLHSVRESAQHMAQLIDGLLTLSRVTRQDLRRAGVDLTALARKITERLRGAQPDRPMECVIAEGLRGEGDAQLLEVALGNLLSNAWKFTGKRERGRIEFGRQEDGNRNVFFVRDNGAGFDMNYATKLFGVFQRLHTAAEFEGTGVGLATVQRVIDRHGGHVWAEGAVGSGATFYFTLGNKEIAS
ncbi:MAG: response regulator [Betaproteobacteria bacterium]|nr:response regulator [Betaproteobacteria bacterium]